MKKREVIQMSSTEIRDFLVEKHSMTLATINKDGTPQLIAMWYGFFDDDSIGMWTFAKSQKIINLNRDNRVTCLVESGMSYDSLKGVQIKGRAELSYDKDNLIEIGSSIYLRYFGHLDEAGKAAVDKMANKRAAIKVVADQIISWDHSKLNGQY